MVPATRSQQRARAVVPSDGRETCTSSSSEVVPSEDHSKDGRPSQAPQKRTRPQLAAWIWFQFAVYQPLRHYVPQWLLNLVMLPGCLYLCYRLLTFRRWSDEKKYALRFIVCLMTFVVQLVLEWELIWLASASDKRKNQTVPALQDNVEIALLDLAERSPAAKAFMRWRWLETLPFLFAFLAAALSVLWDQLPYSGFGIASRMTLTLAASRIIRCACFMATILPNARPGCYRRKYPPLPNSTWDILALPFQRNIKMSGGCNDLIFSGHCGGWTITPLAIQSYYPGHPGLVALLWVGLVQTAARDVLEHYHYSVDMILAVVCTWAAWTWLEWVYPPRESVLPSRPRGQPPDPLPPAVVALVFVGVGFGLFVLFVLGA